MAPSVEPLSRNRTRQAVLAVYVLCFGVATLFHASDIILGGIFPYTFAPFPLNAFWTALVVLDPAVIVLLAIGYMRAALLLAAAIMIADVGANSFAQYSLGIQLFGALQLQTLFLGFVLGSAAFLWPRTASAGEGI